MDGTKFNLQFKFLKPSLGSIPSKFPDAISEGFLSSNFRRGRESFSLPYFDRPATVREVSGDRPGGFREVSGVFSTASGDLSDQ